VDTHGSARSALSLGAAGARVADQLRATLRSLDGEDPDLSGVGRWWEPYQPPLSAAKSGRLRVEQFTVAEWSGWLTSAQIDGRMVPPGTYSRLVETMPDGPDRLWMSDTPSEILDTLPFVWGASGRVVVLGLGLGMIPRLLAARPEVASVDVVEVDADVIALTAPNDPKVTVHHADAFSAADAARVSVNGPWDYALFDIWPTISPEIRPEAASLAEAWASRHVEVWALEHLESEEQRMLREFGLSGSEAAEAVAAMADEIAADARKVS